MKRYKIKTVTPVAVKFFLLITLLLFGLFPATALARHCSQCNYILNPMTELSGITSKNCPQCGNVLERDFAAFDESHDLNTESNNLTLLGMFLGAVGMGALGASIGETSQGAGMVLGGIATGRFLGE